MFVALIADREPKLPDGISLHVIHRRPYVAVGCNASMANTKHNGLSTLPRSQSGYTMAHWHVTNRSFDVVRDICTGRPIYWVSTPSWLLITDCIHGLRLFDVPFEVLSTQLHEFLTYGYVFPPYTLLRDVKQLFPGQCLSVTWDRTASIEVATDSAVDVFIREFAGRQPQADVATTIVEMLSQSDRSDDEIGILMSGGVDSTLLFCCARKRWPDIRSYSASYWFDADRDREKEYSETCASHFGANHRHYKPQALSFFENVIRSIHATGLPLLRMQTALLRSLLSIVPVNCQTLLCGQGADAVFGLSCQLAILCGARVDVLDPGPGVRFLADDLGVNLCAVQASRQRFRAALERAMAPLDVAACLDIAGGMAATQAEWSQVMSSQGREIVYPYLSPSLRGYAIGVDASGKFLEPKHILRQAARKVGIPGWIIEREKASFGPTCVEWKTQLMPLFTISAGAFHEEAMQGALKQDETRYVLWNMLTYSIWRELFIKEQSCDSLIGVVTDIAHG